MDATTYRKRLSIVIRKARNDLGFTQEHMAHKTQINPTYYSKIERGECSIGIDKLEAIAKALHMPLSNLVKLSENI